VKQVNFLPKIVIALLAILSASGVSAQSQLDPTSFTNRSLGGEDRHAESLRKSIEQIQAAGMWDSSFTHAINDIDGGEINALLVVGDTLFIGGDFRYFDTAECFHVVQYDRRTKVFKKLGNGFNGEVLTLAWHKGTLYAGGRFDRPGVNSTASLSHLAAYHGSSWSQVAGGVNANVYALAFMGDSLFVGGYFTMVGTQSISYLALWDGANWTDESNGLNDGVTALFPVGKNLYIGGDFWVPQQNLRSIAMLSPAGISPLATGLDGAPRSFAMINDTLWVGGSFWWTADYTQKLFCLAKWDGTNWLPVQKDTNVGIGTGVVYQVVPIDNSVYVLGNFGNIVGIPAHGIAKLTSGVWSALPTDLYGEGHCAISFDGTLWVGGRYSEAGTLPANGIATFDGARWNQVGSGKSLVDGYNTLDILALATDGRYLYAGGNFTRIANATANHLAAWNRQTRKWSSLGGGVDETVYSLAVFGNHLYVGGSFHRAATISAEHIANWDMVTNTWSAMGAGATRYVSAIAADSSGVYASAFYDISKFGHNIIGRWDGSNWFPIQGDIDGYVNCITHSNGNLFIGGNIYSIAGVRMHNIAYYDGNGWNPMGDGFDNRVLALAKYKSNLYAGGYFINSGSTQLNAIGMWNGVQWQPLGTGLTYTTSSLVGGMATTKDGLYVGGYFNLAGSIPVSSFAKWDGSSWSDQSNGVDRAINAVAYDSVSNAVAVGGNFRLVNRIAPLFSYRLGIFDLGTLAVEELAHPNELSLTNSPNPFAKTTTFHFELDKRQIVRVDVYDELGALRQSIEASLEKGIHDLPFDASKLSPGVYLSVLRTSSSGSMRKLVVLP